MTAPLSLRTRRLVLRPLLPGDAPALVAYRDLPEVARYQSWTSFDLDTATRFVARQADVIPDTPGSWLQLAVVLAATDEIVGDVGLHFRADDPQQMELGITLAPAHQGVGLGREAIEALLGYAFGTLGKHRVIAITDADNDAAARLFERVGLRREAHYVDAVFFKGAWGSEYLFAMLRREWRPHP
ncbi:MAG: GNAT family N-acetyltransferase [Myxococcales bacterium]|jgi:RimJ/RimL family protein N-acetyltransferase|nr:GNAT family N-acetyltransferase [Myxococcales bacterium]